MAYYSFIDGYTNNIFVTSFAEIISLDNYDDIIEINCSYLYKSAEKITNIPKLPKKLTKLNCSNSLLEELPELPKSLVSLECYNSRLKRLPNELPKDLKYINVNNNNIRYLPLCLLKECHINNLSKYNINCSSRHRYWLGTQCACHLSFHNGKSKYKGKCRCGYSMYLYFSLIISCNPVHKKIMKGLGRDKFNMKSYKFLLKEDKYAVCEIENWFLECKYNPKYKYCRDRLNEEFSELYNED